MQKRGMWLYKKEIKEKVCKKQMKKREERKRDSPCFLAITSKFK
jgi:hypothetical protein